MRSSYDGKYTFQWEDMWMGLGFLAVLGLLVSAGFGLFMPHNLDYYYLSTDDAKRGMCVEAHWTWHSDERIYCTDDPKLALQVLLVANRALPQVRPEPIIISIPSADDTAEKSPKPN